MMFLGVGLYLLILNLLLLLERLIMFYAVLHHYLNPS